MYSFGIEEEYFVFDARTRHAVRRIDKRFLNRAQKALGDHVKTEMLQSQIEVVTPPCACAQEARAHLVHYRRTLGQAAGEHKLRLAAMGTFPLAFWPEQMMTPKARYGAIMDDLQMIGMRNMLCGMHVHVEVPDVLTRINLIMRLTPYLPLLLALAWCGCRTPVGVDRSDYREVYAELRTSPLSAGRPSASASFAASASMRVTFSRTVPSRL